MEACRERRATIIANTSRKWMDDAKKATLREALETHIKKQLQTWAGTEKLKTPPIAPYWEDLLLSGVKFAFLKEESADWLATIKTEIEKLPDIASNDPKTAMTIREVVKKLKLLEICGRFQAGEGIGDFGLGKGLEEKWNMRTEEDGSIKSLRLVFAGSPKEKES